MLDAVPDYEKESIGVLLAELGEEIGREGAQDNRVRRVDTPMLQQWGQNLRAAKCGGWDALAEEIRKIDAEVDKILV